MQGVTYKLESDQRKFKKFGIFSVNFRLHILSLPASTQV